MSLNLHEVLGTKPEWDMHRRLARELLDPDGGWTHLADADDETDALLEVLEDHGAVERGRLWVDGGYQLVVWKVIR